mmetsp:Transcript_11425/g.26791  ORF Transcript_11425/g.26791 Transcript_11425/m.26791 type:complete len:477 (+) Transcript_11425:106-1536(+)
MRAIAVPTLFFSFATTSTAAASRGRNRVLGARRLSQGSAVSALLDTEWTVKRYFSPSPAEQLELVDVIPGSTITYTMDGVNSAIGGSGGCNSYFGSYQDLTETEFTIAGPIGSTLMSCGSDLDNQEYNYLSNLSGVLQWKIEGQTLELRDSDSKVVVVYQDLQNLVSPPSDAIFAKTSKSAKSKSTKTYKMFPKSGKGYDAKASKESDWDSSAVPAFAKSSKSKKSKTKPKQDKPLQEHVEEAGQEATAVPTDASESEIHEQEVEKPEVSETTGEEISHSSTTTEATASAGEVSGELHPQNPQWYSTSNPEFVSLTEFHDENDVKASQHAESGLFCYRKGMFLCAYDVVCPNGEGGAPHGGGPPMAGSYESLSETQWVPFYRPNSNPNPGKDDQLSQIEGKQWAQIGAVPEKFGASADDNFGLCWEYDSFGLFSESDMDEVWEDDARGWILCCSDPAEGESEHMEEVLKKLIEREV